MPAGGRAASRPTYSGAICCCASSRLINGHRIAGDKSHKRRGHDHRQRGGKTILVWVKHFISDDGEVSSGSFGKLPS